MNVTQRVLRYACMLSAATFLFTACDDDGTGPSNTKPGNHMPLVSGNYWVYNGYELDQHSSQKVAGSEFRDSTVVEDTTTVAGRHCSRLEHYYDGGEQPADTDYVARDDKNRIYNYLDLLPEDILGGSIELPVNLPLDWYLVADFEAGSWTLFEQNVPEFTITVGSFGNVPISGKVVGKVAKGGKTTIAVDGSNIETQEFILTIDPQLAAVVSSNTIPLEGELTIRLYFADKIGLVRYKQDPLYLWVNVIVPQEIVRAPGEQRDLIKYSVVLEN